LEWAQKENELVAVSGGKCFVNMLFIGKAPFFFTLKLFRSVFSKDLPFLIKVKYTLNFLPLF